MYIINISAKDKEEFKKFIDKVTNTVFSGETVFKADISDFYFAKFKTLNKEDAEKVLDYLDTKNFDIQIIKDKNIKITIVNGKEIKIDCSLFKYLNDVYDFYYQKNKYHEVKDLPDFIAKDFYCTNEKENILKKEDTSEKEKKCKKCPKNNITISYSDEDKVYYAIFNNKKITSDNPYEVLKAIEKENPDFFNKYPEYKEGDKVYDKDGNFIGEAFVLLDNFIICSNGKIFIK